MTDLEIDALMAEKVMRWPVRKARTRGWGSHKKGTLFVDASEHVQYIVGVKGGWNPSADIAQAWRIIEKMAEKGHDVSVARHRIGRNLWSASFDDDVENVSKGETAPKAICLAALRAVGCDVTP